MTRLRGIDEVDIREAAMVIIKGGLVAYPTDTVYGLGCDPFNSEAVDRLSRAKERGKGSFPILVSSLDKAKQLGMFSDVAIQLAARFWPGPFTMVVPALASLPPSVTGDFSTVGLRIPNHETAEKLINNCNGAVIGTSANISGNPSPRTADEVMRQLKDRIDLVLDGGPALVSRESTVARVIQENVTVLREAAIRWDEILKVLEGSPLG